MSYSISFAPLQGYTDAVYRKAHAQVFGGIDTYYTPFVRLEKEGFRKKEIRDIDRRENQNVPLIPQLIASRPDELRALVALFEQEGYNQIDINLGCPFPMQARLHRGAGLLPYTDECIALLRTITEFPTLSFSVKMRLGWEDAEDSMKLIPVLNTLPLKHLTMHPRIGIQQYKGKADWEAFARFMDECRIPLYYNGDLHTVDDINRLTDRFPTLAGCMLGRGLLEHPWLALEYKEGKSLSSDEKRERMIAFHALLVEQYASHLEGGEHQVLSKLQTLWDYLLPDTEKKLRKRIVKSHILTAYLSAVKECLFTL